MTRLQRTRVDILRAADQSVAGEPARSKDRGLTPGQTGQRIAFVRGIIEAGVVGTEPWSPSHRALEYLAVERGALTVTLDGEAFDLEAGDSACYDGGHARALTNFGSEPCVYYLAAFTLRG